MPQCNEFVYQSFTYTSDCSGSSQSDTVLSKSCTPYSDGTYIVWTGCQAESDTDSSSSNLALKIGLGAGAGALVLGGLLYYYFFQTSAVKVSVGATAELVPK